MGPAVPSAPGRTQRLLSFLRFPLLFAVLVAAFLAPAKSGAQSYIWQSAQVAAGGIVEGIVAHPGQNGLFYACTDTGSAYRYNSTTSKWVQSLDWTTPANWSELGQDSIAIDPNSVNMPYNGTVNWVRDIFRSTNDGSSSTQFNGTATQCGSTGVIIGDQQTFGTVYVGTNERGILYGTSSN